MISMTTYWQLFKECVDNLQAPSGNEEYSRQIATANNLIAIGLKIEQLGILEIKQVVNRLGEEAKLFEHQVSYTKDKEYKFNLPKITNSESLIFAIIYYQHLANYENVSYQGSIKWFRQVVIDGINEKKLTTSMQSKALLEEIKRYCQDQKISIDESQFRNKNELPNDYIARISKIPNGDNSANTELKESDKPMETDEIPRLSKLLEELDKKKNQIKIKMNDFSNKLNTFNQAKEKHRLLDTEWQNMWFITRFIYKLISFFYPLPIIKGLNIAQAQLIKAEEDLQKDLAPNETIESYSDDLKNQQNELNSEYVKTKEQLSMQMELKKIALEASKQHQKDIITHLQKSLVSSEVTQPEPQKPDAPSPASNLDYFYGFFKDNRQLIQAAAVAAVAVAVQAYIT